MKKKDIAHINLAFPCKQAWDEMKSDGRNSICDKCSHCVHDFTESNADELANTLGGSSGLVCGRFKKSQLGETFLRYAASTAIVTASLALPALGQETEKTGSAKQANKRVEEMFLGIIVEEQPVPKNGYKAFYRKLSEELKYPGQLAEGGKVFIQFTVDTIGNVVDAEVIKGLNDIADKEALRAFVAVDEKFEPGNQRGKVVRAKMILPVTFDSGEVERKK